MNASANASADTNNCKYFINGTYCVDGELINCQNNQQIGSSVCNIHHTDGCRGLYLCKCVNNWSGRLCNDCLQEKNCDDWTEFIFTFYVFVITMCILIMVLLIYCLYKYVCSYSYNERIIN